MPEYLFSAGIILYRTLLPHSCYRWGTAVNKICATGGISKGTKDNRKMKRKKETEN
jgi:hypothetical protein